jgi:dephospho-CoA kinase
LAKWPGKFVIGITGSIGSGKSVVRRMLERLGAYGIDADEISHQAIKKGAPGYEPVVRTFGSWMLGDQGEVDRAKLARLVFQEPEALGLLEGIVHPLVEQAVSALVKRSRRPVIAVEAIKLLDSALGPEMDSAWVVSAPLEVRIERLVVDRHMEEEDARRRISAQGDGRALIARADVIIDNGGALESTWSQVLDKWQSVVQPGLEARSSSRGVQPGTPVLHVRKATLNDGDSIAAFWGSGAGLSFGENAYLLCFEGDRLRGLLAWRAENLVAQVLDCVLDPGEDAPVVLKALIDNMERSARELQCEVVLVYARTGRNLSPALETLGYARASAESLGFAQWRGVARENQPDGTVLYVKKLRHEVVLRPI